MFYKYSYKGRKEEFVRAETKEWHEMKNKVKRLGPGTNALH